MKIQINKVFDMNKYGGYLVSAITLIIISSFINLSRVDNIGFISIAAVVISLLILFGGLFFVYKKGKFTTNNIVWLIVLSSLFVKIAYSIKYAYTVNQHDIETLNSSGHISYIYRIAQFKGLPDSNSWQFYNPPFHYVLSAIVYKISEFLGCSVDRCFENVQMLTVLWASSFTIVSSKILRILKFKGLPFLLTLAIIAYYPSMTILGGSINNDILSLLLIASALLYLLRLRECENLKNSLLFSCFSGLAIMTKYSAFFAVFAMVIYLFLRSVKSNRLSVKRMALIATPIILIGFWYQVRNAVLFGQEIIYYNEMDEYSLLYISESFLKRLFIIPKLELESVFCAVYNDTNVVLYLLKNSLFGEYTFALETASLLIFFINLVFVALGVVSLVPLLARKRTNCNRFGIMPLIFVFFAEISFYLWFNFIEPFGCNMDFRLIPITLLCGCVFFGCLLTKMHISARKNKLVLAAYVVLFLLILLFVILSSIFFIG